jgi:quercetin dioxygenase-like cupin family protein
MIENPVTGERVTFTKRSEDTGGERIEFEIVAEAHAIGPPEHIHEHPEESFAILYGRVGGTLDGDIFSVEAGESFVIAAGTPHRWWNEGEEELILAYRPDVFDSDAFPAPCLPTIYLTRGRRTRRPGAQRAGDDWYVTLYLEPEVDRDADSYDDRPTAVDAAVDLANRFAAGGVDYRALYQVPREDYLDELDDLTDRA